MMSTQPVITQVDRVGIDDDDLPYHYLGSGEAPKDFGASAGVHQNPVWGNVQELERKAIEEDIIAQKDNSTVEIPGFVLTKAAAGANFASSKKGIFPAISRAWMSVKNEIYLWNYDKGALSKDFVSISVPTKMGTKIIAAVLTTRTDTDRGISFWLVLSTDLTVMLYNLKRTESGGDDKLEIEQGDSCDLGEEGIKMYSLVATPKGRIFMGGSDGVVYEMRHANQGAPGKVKSQRGAKCRKVKQQGWCAKAYSYMPAALQGEKEAIVDLAYIPDESPAASGVVGAGGAATGGGLEGYLYALVRTVPVQAVPERDLIRAFKVKSTDEGSFGPDSMLYMNSSLNRFFDAPSEPHWGIDPKEKAKSLSVVRRGVQARHSKATSYLVVTTTKGRRIFFNSSTSSHPQKVVPQRVPQPGTVIAAHCDQGLTLMASTPPTGRDTELLLLKEDTYHEFQKYRASSARGTQKKWKDGVEEMVLHIPLGEKCTSPVEIAAVDCEVLPGAQVPSGGYDPALIAWGHAELSNQERPERKYVVMTDTHTFIITDPRYPRQMQLAFQKHAEFGTLAVQMFGELTEKNPRSDLSHLIRERIAACLGILCSPQNVGRIATGGSCAVSARRHLKDLVEIGLRQMTPVVNMTPAFANTGVTFTSTKRTTSASDGMCLYFKRVLGPLWQLPFAWKKDTGIFPDVDPVSFVAALQHSTDPVVSSLWDTYKNGAFDEIIHKLELLSKQLEEVIQIGRGSYGGGGGGAAQGGGAARAAVVEASPVLRMGMHAHPRYAQHARQQARQHPGAAVGAFVGTLHPGWKGYFNPNDVCHLYQQEIGEFRGLHHVVKITNEVLSLWQIMHSSETGKFVLEDLQSGVQEFWLKSEGIKAIVSECVSNFDLETPHLHISNKGLDMLRKTIEGVEKVTQKLAKDDPQKAADDVEELRKQLETRCPYIFDNIFSMRKKAEKALEDAANSNSTAAEKSKNVEAAQRAYKQLFEKCALESSASRENGAPTVLSEKEFCRYFNVPAAVSGNGRAGGGGGGGGAASGAGAGGAQAPAAYSLKIVADKFIALKTADAYEYMVDVVLDAAEALQKRAQTGVVAAACDTCYTCIHTVLAAADKDVDKKNRIINRVLSRLQNQRGHFEVFKHTIALKDGDGRKYFKIVNPREHGDWVADVQASSYVVPFLEALAHRDRSEARRRIREDLPGATTLDLGDGSGSGMVKCRYYTSMKLLQEVYKKRFDDARAALMLVRMAFVPFSDYNDFAGDKSELPYLEQCIDHLETAERLIKENSTAGLLEDTFDSYGTLVFEQTEISLHRQQLTYRKVQQHGYIALKERVETLKQRGYLSFDGETPYADNYLGGREDGTPLRPSDLLGYLEKEIYGPVYNGDRNQMEERDGLLRTDMIVLFQRPFPGREESGPPRLWLPGSLIKACSSLGSELPEEFRVDYTSAIEDVLNDRLWANGARPGTLEQSIHNNKPEPTHFVNVLEEANPLLSLQEVLKGYFAESALRQDQPNDPLSDVVLLLEETAFNSEYEMQLDAWKNSECSQSKVIRMLRGAGCRYEDLYKAYKYCFHNPLTDDEDREERAMRLLISLTVLLFNWFYSVEAQASVQGVRNQSLEHFKRAIADDEEGFTYEFEQLDTTKLKPYYRDQRETCYKWLTGLRNNQHFHDY